MKEMEHSTDTTVNHKLVVDIILCLAITTCEPTRIVLYSCGFNNDNGGRGGGGDGAALRTC